MGKGILVAALVAAGVVFGADDAAYDIGRDFAEEVFWASDPVLFVKRHEGQGFQFTSGNRDGADTRLDGAVVYHGIPVYETKVVFGELGGISRVELMLYASAGTEAEEVIATESGRQVRRRVRKAKPITREAFVQIVKDVRAQLTAEGAKAPPIESARTSRPGMVQKFQVWPKTAIPTVAKLTWCYSQEGRRADTFAAGFVRLAVDGPARLTASGAGRAAAPAARGAKKIADNVLRDPRGDVFIDAVPMVDQGQKGYCAVATSERVLRYYGVDVDEHEIAQAAGSTAEGGTSTRAMKDSVQAIGRKYKLGTVVTYGDFEKPPVARIEGLVKEVANYNKAAKKLKKKEIAESVYVRREGNMTIYSPAAVDEAMDPEVLRDMKVNGAQRSKFTRFMKDVHDQIDKGIPLFWGVTLGTYPEPDIPQARGGHMRLIFGYNDKRREILYSDSWGAGHELKRMPADWAWTISHCLMFMKPLR
ncbi:MAG: C39 family peptidase [Kiritimatiellia bacterium]